MSRIKRINKLTSEQEARFTEWRDKWIAIGLQTGQTDWENFEKAARDCYRFAKLAQPKKIIRVESPLTLAFAAPIAQYLLAVRLKKSLVPCCGSAVHGAVDGAIHNAVDCAVIGAVHNAVDDAVRDAVHNVRGAVDGAVHDAVGRDVHGAVHNAVHNAVEDSVRIAVRNAVYDAVRGAVVPVRDAVHNAVHNAVDGAVEDTVDGAVHGAVHNAVGGAVKDAVSDIVKNTVRIAVENAVNDIVEDTVDGAVDGTVYDAIHGAVHNVRGAVEDAVEDTVRVAVRNAVHGAVRGAVEDAVEDTVRVAVRNAVHGAIRNKWINYIGGQFWVGGRWWYSSPTMTSFFREVCNLDLNDDIWNRAIAYEMTAKSACWWWPHWDFIMVCARPVAINRDSRGRLHDLNKAAIKYPDGWGVYAIHGVRVPQCYILTPAEKIDPIEILKEPNTQVRMAVVSKVGFARMLGKLPHKVISRSPNGRGVEQEDELIEFQLDEIPVRGLHVWWREKSGEKKETVMPVWRTRAQFGSDCPENIDDCEQVRRWVMSIPKNAEIIEEI